MNSLLRLACQNFIQIGTLNLTDPSGKVTTFKGKEPGPQAAIHFHTPQSEWRFLKNPDIAIGDGYVNGDITCEGGTLYDLLDLVTRNYVLARSHWLLTLLRKLDYPLRFWRQSKSRQTAKRQISHHYDLNVEMYKLFLDHDLQYSCAYFTDPNDTLDAAQENKKRHIAAKLRLQPGQKILDIGSGWGGLAIYLAQHENVEVTGITLSEEQCKIANERAKEAGLQDRVKFFVRDYRDEKQQYDRIVSIGMFEHVGVPHYLEFFQKVEALLKKDGVALIHAIGRSTEPEDNNSWIGTYIFPGGYCPALSEVFSRIEHVPLFVTDIEILRHHYAQTLKNWLINFEKNRDKAKALYDEKFCRMWEFYLTECQFVFQNIGFMVFQIQLVKDQEIAPWTRNYINEWELEELRR
jgi:cyclopropane-fatty-acyl-phospholipid synthase